MRVSAVVVAAGAGQRMAINLRKQYLSLGGVPVVVRSLQLFLDHPAVKEVVAVIPPGEAGIVEELLRPYFPPQKVKLVDGGASRPESVDRGLKALEEETELVCIHDAARPLASAGLLDRLLSTAARWGAAVPVLELSDTVKEIDGAGFILSTPDREKLRLVQTPQVFKRDIILEAYRNSAAAALNATDDARLVELSGRAIKTVPGEPENIKITRQLDLKLATLLLEGKETK